jgi:hypothetical protein
MGGDHQEKPMKMNATKPIVLAALAVLLAGSGKADDFRAKVYFSGSLYNSSIRQALYGKYRGNGEFDFLNVKGRMTGTVGSQTGTRTPENRVMGIYPVVVDVKVSRSGGSISKDFVGTAVVRRRAIYLKDHGSVKLKRAINPRKKGRQKVSGIGVFTYNF